MGNYNPHTPIILGQEWVPIRDEDLIYSPSVNAVEFGTVYTQTTAQRPRDARFYSHENPQDGQTFFQVVEFGLYPAGAENDSGPIQQVIIPVSNVTITGGSVTVQGPDATTALYQPGDSQYLRFAKPSGTPTAISGVISAYFNANAYPILNGKRILNVSLLYRGSVQDGGPSDFVNPFPSLFALSLVSQLNDAGVGIQFPALSFVNETGTLTLNTKIGPAAFALQEAQTLALNIGDVNNCWDAANPAGTDEKLPWTYADLQRFEFGGANRQHIEIQIVLPETPIGVTSANVYLDYLALRVLYCEERRVAYGAQQFKYSYGMNKITIRDLSRNADPVIQPGLYLPTLSAVSMGQVGRGFGTTGEFPKLNAVRQFYEISSHPGVKLNVPFPPENRLGDVFTSEITNVLPQISIHTSGATLTEPHVYGRQAVAQVYGSITATQEILDGVIGSATTWPQVRYYARRFGATTVPLLLDSPTITGVGMNVTLTPAEWDALPEILDGWKEITKRFASAPTMGTGANPQWRWSATGEVVGNRWEVLGAIAPAISGVPGSFVTQVPTAQRLTTATYGAPTAGSTVNMGWIPGYSPLVTATTDDSMTDAVLIFSQDPVTISGFTVNTTTQALTGFTNCTKSPCCIPSALSYNQIGWVPVLGAGGLSLPGTSGSYASTPDNAALDILGDFDLRADATLVNWTTLAQVLVGKWDGNTNQRSYRLGITATGGLQVFLSSNGTATLNAISTVNPPTMPNGRLAVRVTVDVDNGAGGWTATFYTAPTIDDPWVQLGDPVITATITSIFNSTSAAEVGSANVGTFNVVNGTIHAAEIRNGIAGAAVANPNFRNILPGTTSFTDAAGRVWTVNGSAAIVNLDNPLLSAIELQRADAVEPDFKTIMLASNTTVNSFKDYEAKVGVLSSYRARVLNVLNFAGPWSSTTTATIPEPGVTLPSCGTNKRGVLIFTSNEDQTGSRNLAYAMTWDGEVVEDFGFIEAGSIDIQQYHDRDYQVAFHGSERGGEQFSRRLLIANAAVALPRLANVRSLRDMAWVDLSYVCVRDDIGDRWFATVIVPRDEVRRNRKLYNADITVIEVTATPTQVNP